MSTTRVKTIFDDQKFKLTSKPLKPGGQPPTLQMGFWNKNPQITVYPNAGEGSNYSMISAHMDIFTMNLLFETILRLTEGDGEDTVKIENKKQIPKEQRTDPKVKLMIASETLIRRDSEGRISITINDPNKPHEEMITFIFGVNYYHTFKSKSGMSPGEISKLAARAWVKTMQGLTSSYLITTTTQYTPPQPYTGKSGGGNSGGGQQRQQASSSSNSGSYGDYDPDWD